MTRPTTCVTAASAPADPARTSGRGGLRQEARRDGDHVVLSIVNGGTAPVVVPLRFHPGRPELAFTVLAESEQKAVFVLEPPSNDAPGEAPRIDAGVAPVIRSLGIGDFDFDVGLDAGSSFLRVYSARIRLAPGGAARARLAIDPRIAKRLDRSCGAGSSGASAAARASSGPGAPDGGPGGGPEQACLPPRLPKGRVVLYVGQLVAAVDAGEPARVEWDAP